MTDDDPDPRSSAADARRCAACGSAIDTGEWHPLVARVDADGRFRVRAFRCPACKRAWSDGMDRVSHGSITRRRS